MPQLSVYSLEPRSALHVGQRGVGLEETRYHIPADTLFAALLATWVQLGGRAEEWTNAFPRDDAGGNPPFLLTSAFPYAGGVRFYPMPQADLSRLGIQIGERRKDLKRIAFVSEGIFRRMTTGQPLVSYFHDEGADPQDGVFLQDRNLWLARDEVPQLPETMRRGQPASGARRERPLRALEHAVVWVEGKVPRVTIDRRTNASNIFHTGRVSFAPGCGLWFGVRWLAPATEQARYHHMLEQALSALADAGLGGERSVGYGAFTWKRHGEDAVEWPDPAPGDLYVTLSRYHPRSCEAPASFTGDGVAYSLQAVAGYLYSPLLAGQRRRRLQLVAEGSVLRATDRPPFGDLVDVRPQVGSFPHPVWRYGLAWPVKLEVPHGK